MQADSEELDLEALIREACELVKAKIEAEEGLIMESDQRRSEEEASLTLEIGAYTEAGRACNGDTREGAEKATLSPCGEGTAMEAGNYGFGTSGGVATLGCRTVAEAKRATTTTMCERVRSERPSRLAERGRPWMRPAAMEREAPLREWA